MTSWPSACHRVLTSHSPSHADGSSVDLHISDVPLRPVLRDNAAITPLFSSLGLPATSTPTLTDEEIASATERVKGVVLPNGVCGQVTDVKPNFRIDMHRTNSIDYNVFVAGSAYLITPRKGPNGEETEERTLVKAGEVVVQRGTIHAWESGPEGARWISVIVAADPVEMDGKKLDEVDFQ